MHACSDFTAQLRKLLLGCFARFTGYLFAFAIGQRQLPQPSSAFFIMVDRTFTVFTFLRHVYASSMPFAMSRWIATTGTKRHLPIVTV
jgi:hypothetical protein